jgi:thiol-disulfide isomerase/thioredoxin
VNRTLILRTGLASLSVIVVLVAGLFLFVKEKRHSLEGDLANLLVGELLTFEFIEPMQAVTGTSFVDDKDGRFSLEDYRGKVVLLNLWATWCAPCLNEMPTLDRLKAELGSDDFEVLAVSIDRGEIEKSRIFLDRTGAQHLALLVDETHELNFAFKAYTLPTTLLLDREGRLIGRIVGDTVWDSREVKRLIKAVIAQTAPTPLPKASEEVSELSKVPQGPFDQGSSSLSQYRKSIQLS